MDQDHPSQPGKSEETELGSTETAAPTPVRSEGQMGNVGLMEQREGRMGNVG